MKQGYQTALAFSAVILSAIALIFGLRTGLAQAVPLEQKAPKYEVLAVPHSRTAIEKYINEEVRSGWRFVTIVPAQDSDGDFIVFTR